MLDEDKIDSDWDSGFPVEPKFIIAGVGALLAVLLFATPFAMDAYLLEKQDASFNTSAEVVANNTSIGAAAGTNQLDFGRLISDNMNVTREINVGTGRDTIVLVDIEGNITEHLKYEEVHRFNGSKDIQFEMVAREPGNYTGTVDLNVQAVKQEGGSAWLDIKQEFY
jgi:hypothetical protein